MTEDLDWRALRRMADLHAVYRMFDAQGRLLYIGMTKDVGKRLGDHTARRWFPLVTNITLQWCQTKAAARVTEVRAIRNERPRYNIADRFGRMPEDVPAPMRAAPKLTEIAAAIPDVLPERPLPDEVSLSEAVTREVVSCTLGAMRMARHRNQKFPAPVGKRGIVLLYDPAALAEWDIRRRQPQVAAEPTFPERVTLAEAVRLHVVKCNLTALRKASQRSPFPQRLGTRGIAAEYDPAALAEWDMGRR